MNTRLFSSSDNRYRVRLPDNLVDRMLVFCSSAGERETGGILVGYYTEGHNLAVATDLSGPPPNSRSSRFHFLRGNHGLKQWLSTLWSGPRHYYLGEWHFHPGNTPTPSGSDQNQMREIADSPAYSCPEPLLIIIGGDPAGVWTLSVQVYAHQKSAITLIGVQGEPAPEITETQ